MTVRKEKQDPDPNEKVCLIAYRQKDGTVTYRRLRTPSWERKKTK